ncbi:MAG: HAMP domain-containing histidine kinase [Planctomycetales bacterium]|nr:HAMP domain-containing histidine kinase [Planctomycetales bacterium]
MAPSTGRDLSLRPVLWLLTLALVPSVGVMWMMRAALDNERLATRQRLADAYGTQAELAVQDVERQFAQLLNDVDQFRITTSPSKAFAHAVITTPLHSVILYDELGKLVYPDLAAHEPLVETSAIWRRAERLEFVDSEPLAAAEAFGDIASTTDDVVEKARAQMAQSRALEKAGRRDAAIAILDEVRAANSDIRQEGRTIAADAEMRRLELLQEGGRLQTRDAEWLQSTLNNYGDHGPSAAQRLFLLRRLHSLVPDADLPTLEAEELAVQYLGRQVAAPPNASLTSAGLANVSHVRLPSGRGVALFRVDNVRDWLQRLAQRQPLPEYVEPIILTPKERVAEGDWLSERPIEGFEAGWRIAMRLSNSQAYDAAARQSAAPLAWIGGIVVALTSTLAFAAARSMREQARLTRLKNDLVATVSHELKTPLASTRVLVDTLLAGPGAASDGAAWERRSREYLEMISRENRRLSRLIDNFLTFSRMERGKHRFNFQSMDARRAIELALEAVHERFDGAENTLAVDIVGSLPIEGDVDALSTAVLNLLDNAWKYSDSPRRVHVAAVRSGDRIKICVEDNGRGIAPRDARRVFERFYQADQTLSRSHEGCGLGLSIVKYIVEAHEGVVELDANRGRGCKFIIELPAQNDDLVAALQPDVHSKDDESL